MDCELCDNIVPEKRAEFLIKYKKPVICIACAENTVQRVSGFQIAHDKSCRTIQVCTPSEGRNLSKMQRGMGGKYEAVSKADIKEIVTSKETTTIISKNFKKWKNFDIALIMSLNEIKSEQDLKLLNINKFNNKEYANKVAKTMLKYKSLDNMLDIIKDKLPILYKLLMDNKTIITYMKFHGLTSL